MSSVTTLLYQFLKKRFGNFDWGNGSVIRALVAEPVVELAEQAVSAVNGVYAELDISALLDAPEDHIEAIDKLFSEMGLRSPDASVSTGTVRLLLSTNAAFSIPAGASFTYDDITLITTDTYNVPADLALTRVGADAYEVHVPVSSTVEGVNLAEGTELTWGDIIADIYSATVYSTITGGVNDYTAAQKINLIRQQLFPVGLTAQESVLRAINSNTPDLAVDCAFAPTSPIGTTDIYVKTVAAPSTWEEPATAELTTTANVYSVTIPLAGVARVNRIIISDTSYTPQAITRVDRSLTITFAANLGGTDTAAATVEVFGLHTMSVVQDALDTYTANTGLRLIAQTPELLSLGIQIPVASGVITNDVGTAVSADINISRLNASGIGDNSLRGLLVDRGVTTAGSGVYTLTRYLTGNVKSTIGTIDPGLLVGGVKPYAIYSYNNLVTFINA